MHELGETAARGLRRAFRLRVPSPDVASPVPLCSLGAVEPAVAALAGSAAALPQQDRGVTSAVSVRPDHSVASIDSTQSQTAIVPHDSACCDSLGAGGAGSSDLRFSMPALPRSRDGGAKVLLCAGARRQAAQGRALATQRSSGVATEALEAFAEARR